MEAVILSAAKAACLAAAGISKIPSIQRFDASVPPSIGLIKNPDFNKLNRVRNLGPEPFYYFCQGLDMLGLI